jgi:hypothetical protein
MFVLFRPLSRLLLTALFILSLFAFRSADEKPAITAYLLQKPDGDQSPCHPTAQGPVIDWRSDYKLKYRDFKAATRSSPGFAVATTSSAFGYSITDRGGEVSGSIYVRFYCEESWWNPDFRLDEVLEHEQLHFDICELFGRKFYKAVLTLRDNGNLNHRSMKRLKSEFEKQYDAWQGQYDSETDHGTKGDEQRKWNQKIKRRLDELSEYADYSAF